MKDPYQQTATITLWFTEKYSTGIPRPMESIGIHIMLTPMEQTFDDSVLFFHSLLLVKRSWCLSINIF